MSIPYLFEVCGIKINGTHILCIYRPKTQKGDNFMNNLENMLNIIQKNKERQVIICGDFNINTLLDSTESREFKSLLISYGLKMYINEPTRVTNHSSTCIDNILSNIDLNDAKVIEFGLSDHTLQQVCLPIPIKRNPRYFIQARDLKQANLEKLKTYLLSVSWEEVFKSTDCDKGFNIFHDILTRAFDDLCPKIKIKAGHAKCDRGWITPGIKKSCESKRELFIRVKTTKDDDLKKKYNTFCRVLNKVIAFAKRDYNEKKIVNADDKIKSMWNLINENTKGKKIVETNNYIGLSDGKKKATTNYDAPDIFNDFFSSIGSHNTEKPTANGNCAENNFLPPAGINNMFLHPVSMDELSKTVNSLKNKKSSGYDDIPTSVIKYVFDTIALPLHYLINLSFSQGVFPTRLKKAHVKPIHKKEDKLDVNNYRPISLLVTLSKIFEKCMSNRLRRFIGANKILAREQFGFQKGASTVDAIFEMTDFVTEALDGKDNVATVLLDLSKAFDNVNHEVLLEILDRYGIRGVVNEWFRSYLKNRQQSVILPILDESKTLVNIQSNTSLIENGVPQGSILGPILFLLYVNNLPRVVQEKVVMFADDVSVFFKINKNDERNFGLEISETIQIIINWFKHLNLNTNVNKTKLLYFRNYNSKIFNDEVNADGVKIDCVKHAKFLGIHTDENVNWKKHIEVLQNKLSSFCYALRSLSNLATKRATLIAYYAFFQSRILYGLAVWGGSVDIDKILILQKRCIRILDGLKSNRESCRDSFKKLKILTITALYVIELCKLVKRYPNKFPLRTLGASNRLNEKFKYDLEVPASRTVTYSRTTKMAAIKVFNSLPDEIKSLTGTKFFTKLKEFLIVMCPYSLNEFYDFKPAA